MVALLSACNAAFCFAISVVSPLPSPIFSNLLYAATVTSFGIVETNLFHEKDRN